MSNAKNRARKLLDEHGQTFADEIGIDLDRNEPMPLFQWLVASLLFSARIGAAQAVEAARTLNDAGLTTAEHMCNASWQQRVDVLNANGYARYDESSSTKLGKTSELLLERWHGDLRELREEAGGDAKSILKLLQQFNGIGPLGAQIFARETQAVWNELAPFADQKALDAAKRLKLGDDAEALADLVGQDRLPQLLAALMRASLDKSLGDNI